MKKTALTILLTAFAAVMALAQTPYDAWLFSENIYEGTARSVAMGNAFTALGGDLGAVSINPAGSAVAGYSQLTLTPSLTVSTSTTEGIPYEGSQSPYFQRKMKSSISNAGLPNVGFTFNFDTGRTSGLKSITAGFIVNCTNSWNEDVYASGTNNATSFLAAAAADISSVGGITPDMLKDNNAYNNPDLLWKEIVGYRSGMFSTMNSQPDVYAGATELIFTNGEIALGGPLKQTYGRSVSGNKYEYIFNIGANISDFVYLGFNLGINSLSYDMTHYFKESAEDPYDFKNDFTDQNGDIHTTYFKDARYKYSYSASGTGVFGKFGVIVTPGSGLRIGAAIQTPTTNQITEQWQESAYTDFTESEFNGNADSPLGNSKYEFNSPWRANIGAAYTLGRLAVVSVDYEAADFGSMRFNAGHGSDYRELFDELNTEIKDTYGWAHQVRIGAEFKPLSTLAVRAGYNLNTSAQKKFLLDGRLEDIDTFYTHYLSFGVGYNSKKSFFADIACRHQFATNESIFPYSDYLEDYGILSPEILNRHSNWKILLTLGWRF